MDIKKTAIVTALFDIGRDKWDNYEQSYHTYIEWMKNLLSLNSKIVIYTEEKFSSQIIEIIGSVPTLYWIGYSSGLTGPSAAVGLWNNV